MKKYISFIAVIFAVGIAGCKKDYLSQEQNPNQPSITTPTLLLPAAEVRTAYIYQRAYPMYGVWDGYWTTSGNYVPNPSINEYQITSSDFGLPDNDIWTDLYLTNANLNTLQGLSTGSANANYAAIAIILKAFNFEQLVDNYNDVPYTQAFDTKNVTPAFDKGQDIYHDLGKQLDNAIKLIQDNPNATLPTTDVIFSGDMTQWAKFANTIKLRLAVMVYKKLGTSDPLVADLSSTASVGYLDADAAVNPGYQQSLSGAGASQESPFYGSYGFDVNGNATGNNNYYRANAFAVSFYNDNNDPRASKFYLPTSSGGIIQGNVFGDIAHNNANPKTSAIGPGLLQSPTQNAVLFSASESDFLQAEAINQNLIPASSTAFASDQVAYEQGITDSFTELGLTAAQATTYYSQNTDNVGWAPSPNKLTAILTQKWAAMNGWFNLVAFNDYRRTGIPNLPSSVDPTAIGTHLPTRILYPLSELSTNTANVGKEGTINPLTSKIFWAQ